MPVKDALQVAYAAIGQQDQVGQEMAQACKGGDLAAVRDLVEKQQGAVCCVDEYGMTGLHHAAASGCPRIVEFLLEHGTDLAACTNAGNTPLHCAAFSGGREIVSTLLQAGAAVDVKNEDGETPLMRAVKGQQAESAVLLILAGAGTESRSIKKAFEKASGDFSREFDDLLNGIQADMVATACETGTTEPVATFRKPLRFRAPGQV